MKTLQDYLEKGYRCYNTKTSTKTSSIYLVKGELTAVAEYRLALESRSLDSFEYNFDTQMIKMEFFRRPIYQSGLTPFEIKQLDFLKTIKSYSGTYLSDRAFVQIYSFHPDKVKFIIPEKNTVKLFSDTKIELEGCPDCTDGFYYPLVGPREPCQTCSHLSSNFETFVQDVTDMFVKYVKVHMPALVKDNKDPYNQWKTFHLDIIVKDPSVNLIAFNAGVQMAKKLKDIYINTPVAFDNLTMYCPMLERGSIYKKAINLGVSATVVAKETVNGMELQFQVRVST